MKKIYLTLALFCCIMSALAQNETNSKQWLGLGAATRFSGLGVTFSYRQQDLLAPGTDARFSASYVGPAYYNIGFSAEVSADALAYTYDPDPEIGSGARRLRRPWAALTRSDRALRHYGF